jgi:hypothetical protein
MMPAGTSASSLFRVALNLGWGFGAIGFGIHIHDLHIKDAVCLPHCHSPRIRMLPLSVSWEKWVSWMTGFGITAGTLVAGTV